MAKRLKQRVNIDGTIHEIVMVLGMILESAVEDGILLRNPARSKRLKIHRNA